MRILMVLYNLAGKGTYWRGLYLARGLAQQGHEITVMATSPSARTGFHTRRDVPGVTIVETPDLLSGPLRSGWDPWNVANRIRWSRSQQFDLVHAFESRPTAIYPALYWQRRGAKLVLDWCDWFGRGGSVEERTSALVRALLRPVETFYEEHFRTRAEGTTVINKVLGQRAVALGVEPSTILLLPNGSNVEEIRPVPQEVARRQLGWPEDAGVIAYIGTIFDRDARLMARAFDQIHAGNANTRLLIAGYCPVPVEDYVQNPDAVWRTGLLPYEQISLYLSASDICWLPFADSGANRGRYPLKISDYMAAGRPVVATEVGDIPDLIAEGQFGQVTADTPEALAAAVLALLQDREQRETMGARGRRFAETSLTWEQISAGLGQFYERVLQGSRQ